MTTPVPPFERLHPALRHHIVNSLGWQSLRPFQEAVLEPILTGEHLVVLAPTAGGKTEAAFFPVLSRALAESWTGLSILYLCPIKALLNNLETRLGRYCSLVGRRAALWHGDVPSSARKAILRDPPDCLLTTPESLEVMLVSPNVEARALFTGLQAVIIDEIHAFAGDDRGWHLLSVLERVGRIAGRELQRIGLSATVGNPDRLLEWLAGPCTGPKRVFRPSEAVVGDADVRLDYVGSLANVALVISRLHRGEKRLAFVDSRSRAEQLAADLRRHDVTTFVTHSSLSREQRRQAEEAFASRENCVIVATGVLELGVDVGDLDRVIQIDAPGSVSGFLQRMGRTGRRLETARNCLFLATSDDALIESAGLIGLWESGFIEPVEPPPKPYHLLAQQLMALALQERGIGRQDWRGWIGRVPAFAELPAERAEEIIAFMVEREILWEEAGILGIGRNGEDKYGRRHFLELMSVFLSPPLFTVLSGRREVGFVDELSFLSKSDGPRILSLGGRSWQVTHLEWRRRIAYVRPSDDHGCTRWTGQGRSMSHALAQSVKRVLHSDEFPERWSRRARERIAEIRLDFARLDSEGTVVDFDAEGRAKWWTFAGSRANAMLAASLQSPSSRSLTHNGLAIQYRRTVPLDDVMASVHESRRRSTSEFVPQIDEKVIQGLKFSDCLPESLALEELRSRASDSPAIELLLQEPVRFVSG